MIHKVIILKLLTNSLKEVNAKLLYQKANTQYPNVDNSTNSSEFYILNIFQKLGSLEGE